MILKLLNYFDNKLGSSRLIFFPCDVLKFEFLMYLLILLSYFTWLAALLCCFELLVDWWRNQLIEFCWSKIFLCGIEVFDCFEELFLLKLFKWYFWFLASSRKNLSQFIDAFRCSAFYLSVVFLNLIFWCIFI